MRRLERPKINPVLAFVYALWSVFAWPLNFACILLGLIAAAPFWIFMPFERVQSWTIAPIFWRSLWVTFNRVRFIRHNAYDRSRVAVYTMNHTSMLDAHCGIGAIRAPFCGLENAAHYRIPIYGWAMRAANGIAVHKGAGRLASLIEQAIDRQRRGISILTFPEGHRTLDGSVGKFHSGPFIMAREANMPIVPLAVHGMYNCLHKGTWTIRPGTLTILIGPTMETAGKDDAALREMAEKVRWYVEEFVMTGVVPPDSLLR